MAIYSPWRVVMHAVPLGLVVSSCGSSSATSAMPSNGDSPDASTATTVDGGHGDGGGSVATDGSANGDDASSAAPADCPASDVGNTSLGQDTPDPTGTPVNAITYTNVGATGSYNQVVTSTVAPTCVANVCDTTPKAESGPLVPFDDEMTMVFSGPMDLYQIAAYAPGASGYERVAYWDRCTTTGLAFVGNKSWYQCNGYVQSYVSNDGTAESDTPVQFAGHLDAGVGVNVMSDVLCTGTTSGTDCGFSRGLALHGFKGDAAGNKIFVTKLRMPIGDVTPAYWILPAQVVRSAQYGCNCRGEGGQGGCGELDVAEVLGGATATPAHPMQATTTIYSFQGVTNGGTSYFQRPVYESATFVVVFDAASSSIAMRRLGATDFDFGGSIAQATLDAWLADSGMSRAMP
jgi:Putative TOS1-like glycosyl hydrolase (DUF2401)/Glycine-rich protein domain (DUF2403)